MNIREFTPGVFYVGVNDRVKQIFEALWPIPHGVSYNSYIVKGENASALIDTVQIDEVCRFLNNIESALDGKAPDYLVINHMEPDHSGAIPEVVRAYPNLKLVGNAQTISMVRGFYHIADDSRFLEVKDGAEIDLGGKTLRFYLTPMVHWPETMMTYLPEDKLLFAGDAFGCFGALNGGVTDAEMDTDCYFPEMYRYYTNIVGKYGKFVQKALAKLQSLEVETICSTHGPVWRERVGEVIALYDQLSAYRSEPGVTIVYGSMYGNTAEVAEEIARQLTARGVRNIKIHNAAVSSMSDMITDAFRYEGLIVGSTTYSMRLFPPVEQFLNAMETREVQGKVFATFGGYTWAKAAVPAIMQGYAERMKMPIVAQMMMCRSVDDAMLTEARVLADKVADELTLKN
jgi:flavorubredoxin